MNATAQTLLRSVLKIFAGYLIAKGFTDESQAEIVVAGVVGLVGIVWGLFHRKAQSKTVTVTKVVSLLLAGAVTLLNGCARFTTTQTDVSYEKGQPQRSIQTRAKATTFFASSSALANWKAAQTDKTQSASVGSLIQQSNGTNVVDLVDRIVGAAVSAGVKAAAP